MLANIMEYPITITSIFNFYIPVTNNIIYINYIMDILEITLKNIKFPIAIWKKNDKNKYVCYFTNDKINGIKKGTHLNKYIFVTDLHFKDFYNEISINKTDLTIKYNNVYVTINYIDDTSFFEIHTPTENMNLLATISHKIRLPLTNIMGIMTLIDTATMNEENKKYLNILKESSCLITNVVNDIIDILNIQQNKIKLTHDHINVNSLIKKCINVTPNAKKNINVVTNINSNVPDVIISDSNKLMQIIINILSNAFKYTSHGAITITVSINPHKNTQKSIKHEKKFTNDIHDILFTIKDTGCGMSQQQKTHVKNIINTTSMTYDNYIDGFGLIICANFCKMLGGKIWFKTEIDIGTIFYFNVICTGLKIV